MEVLYIVILTLYFLFFFASAATLLVGVAVLLFEVHRAILVEDEANPRKTADAEDDKK